MHLISIVARSRNSSKLNREKSSLRPPHRSQAPRQFSHCDDTRSVQARLTRAIIDTMPFISCGLSEWPFRGEPLRGLFRNARLDHAPLRHLGFDPGPSGAIGLVAALRRLA